MVKVPIFDPSNMGIKDKLDYVNEHIEKYIELTEHEAPIGYINFVLPGFLSEKPELNALAISPNLVDEAMVAGFYDKDIYLYINYFANKDDAVERLHMYTTDSIIRERRVSPNWKLVVFFPMHTIEETVGKEKFNMKYGLQLVGPEINLMNIQKYIKAGISHFNLIFMDIKTEMTLIPAKLELLKDMSEKYPDVQFLIYSSDSDKLKLPENCRVIVGSSFWKKYLMD
ncbi:MAG: hypothetical protein ACRCXZ_01275 [Patescibacteria group bacterium]